MPLDPKEFEAELEDLSIEDEFGDYTAELGIYPAVKFKTGYKVVIYKGYGVDEIVDELDSGIDPLPVIKKILEYMPQKIRVAWFDRGNGKWHKQTIGWNDNYYQVFHHNPISQIKKLTDLLNSEIED